MHSVFFVTVGFRVLQTDWAEVGEEELRQPAVKSTSWLAGKETGQDFFGTKGSTQSLETLAEVKEEAALGSANSTLLWTHLWSEKLSKYTVDCLQYIPWFTYQVF